MTFRGQVTIVNAAIVSGLAWEYYQGAPLLSLGVAGIGMVLLANAIFWFRWSRRKKAGIGTGQVQGY